ncbi:hypothetical protein DFS33DRAFT_1388159 [Desarmillaria ectypa]|nr:hypothetical protein DFS33DRAFT_1388159 [Desarmillaria ectypa]
MLHSTSTLASNLVLFPSRIQDSLLPFSVPLYWDTRSSDDDFLALAKYYIHRLLRLSKTPIPVPPDHPSSPSIELEQSSALLRDGHHCMLKPNLYDIQYVERNRSTVEARNPNWDVGSIKCTHIFPESYLGDDAELPSDKRGWAAMHMFSLEELNGTGIHRLENILTLSSALHELFRQ